ncbi:hypothetical protein Enr13x_04210 [Stieleria neptunia]|uniref:Uncharacterized protein n=1 Tax=Stieleria neptunia TaxID=2527979 RepID=A0A518HIC9_9BACT|nr:hypothetical protein Enr13x_04210 [Stieleria neptunia]
MLFDVTSDMGEVHNIALAQPKPTTGRPWQHESPEKTPSDRKAVIVKVTIVLLTMSMFAILLTAKTERLKRY